MFNFHIVNNTKCQLSNLTSFRHLNFKKFNKINYFEFENEKLLTFKFKAIHHWKNQLHFCRISKFWNWYWIIVEIQIWKVQLSKSTLKTIRLKLQNYQHSNLKSSIVTLSTFKNLNLQLENSRQMNLKKIKLRCVSKLEKKIILSRIRNLILKLDYCRHLNFKKLIMSLYCKFSKFECRQLVQI